jgi:translation initiation factor IF-3
MTVGTGEGDLTIKAKQASAWIKEGHRVKIELKLRGRSNAIDQNFLKERLQRVLILITEEYKVAEDIKKIPNGMIMVIEKGKKAA